MSNATLDKLRLKHPNLPEVVLVKKYYPKVRKHKKKRTWKLKHLKTVEREEEDEGVDADGKKIKQNKRFQ
jgi:hypothetical protein